MEGLAALEVLLNWTARGAVPAVTFEVKLATGGTGAAAVTVTGTITLWPSTVAVIYAVPVDEGKKVVEATPDSVYAVDAENVPSPEVNTTGVPLAAVPP